MRTYRRRVRHGPQFGRFALVRHRGRHYGIEVLHEGVLAQQLRAARCVSLLVPRAKVLSDEGSVAVGKVAVVDLLGVVCAGQPPRCSRSYGTERKAQAGSEHERAEHTVQLVAVQMLGARVALAAARVRAFKLLVEAFSAPPSLPRAACAFGGIGGVANIAIRLVSVAPAASVVVTVWGRGGVVDGGAAGVHFLGEGLQLAQVGALGCMHWQDLRSHRGRARRLQRQREVLRVSVGWRVLGPSVSRRRRRCSTSRGRVWYGWIWLDLAGSGWGWVRHAEDAVARGLSKSTVVRATRGRGGRRRGSRSGRSRDATTGGLAG